MSWSPDLFIGELRPWPDSVYVVRSRTVETRRYVPEDALVHMELHECPACANVADLQDALDENARLRSCLSDDAENARMIMAENEKLRELVRIMAYCTQGWRDCDGCRMNGADGNIAEPCGCVGLLDRLRELGVEVDE